MIKGSCLCQGVQFTINGELGPISHCHCRTCQKAHTAAFGTVARANLSDLTIDQGQDLLKAYQSSEHKKRYFCGKCGSPLHAEYSTDGVAVISIASLDGTPPKKPERHIFVSEKAPWYDITDNLPQFDKWPE